MPRPASRYTTLCCALLAASLLHSQTTSAPLDPTRNITFSVQPHTPLPEQYIWTAADRTLLRADRNKFSWARTDLRVDPHFFRAHFQLATVPSAATLYIAGPRSARVFLNGKLLGDFSTSTDQPINFRVFHANALSTLHRGDNVLAIEAVRGRGIVSGAGPRATQELAYGEVLVAKLLAAPFGAADAPTILLSDTHWHSVAAAPSTDWASPTFDDSTWPAVSTLGPIESNVDFFQWSADAGMYGWPGYLGMSPALRTFPVSPQQVTHVFHGQGNIANLEALTSHANTPFTVSLPSPPPTDAEAPSLLLDFGREIAGRLYVESASPTDALLSIAYGESELEALATGITPTQRGGNYLGTNLLDVPANGIARAPKSAFRYARIRFLRGAPTTTFRSIRAEGIVYPVTFTGSFESSDPLLNRIWETGAYTAHLCMQDGIWDAPKRDRGRWTGDLYVEARTITAAFGETTLIEDTLRRLAEGTAPGAHVNGIAGYTALWVTTLDDLYRYTGDLAFLKSQHANLLRFLTVMSNDIDPATGTLRPTSKGWGFVDWSPGLYGSTPATRTGTTLEFLFAFQKAPALLEAMGDPSAATHYREEASHILSACRHEFLSPATPTVGTTWQLNTLAELTGVTASPSTAVWDKVLSHVKQDSPTDQVISPYFNAFLIEAMAHSGHPQQSLNWIRAYWGGMLAEGATSFWESYDLRWPKTNFHLSLEADGTSGYFVSLAHGWSSGPTAWLQQHVLGVTAVSPGFDTVELRPNLLDLQFARGAVPTPHGPIAISIDRSAGFTVDLPSGIRSAELFLPAAPAGSAPIHLDHQGHFTFPLNATAAK